MVSYKAAKTIKSKGYFNAKVFLNKVNATEYDLGMITATYNCKTNKIEVGMY